MCNIDRIGRDPIENAIGISAERDDANPGTLGGPAGAFWPTRDVGHDKTEPAFNGGRRVGQCRASQSAIASRSLKASSV
jgi:hypothetical protein